MINLPRNYSTLILGVILIFLLGTVTTQLIGKRAETTLREDIYYTVELALAATDPAHVAALPVTSDDVFNPVYIRLREQYLKLQKPMQEKNIRWIYVMKLFEDEVRFVVDSVGLDDPGHSEPGVIYEQPPAALFEAIRLKTPQFTGPFTDEYGTYYSVFSPIRDNGNMIGVLAADMEAVRYQAIIRSYQIIPILVTFFSEIIFILLFFYFHHRHHVEKMKSEFISIASHELKTPITGMQWIVEDLVKNKRLKSMTSVRKKFVELQEVVLHMREIINTLLNVSRMEAGHIAIQPEKTDLVDVVKSVMQETRTMAKRKKQNVTLTIDKKLPKVAVDPILIREVYKNLLTNAIKYSPEGGLIDIKLTHTGSQIRSQVIDHGYGIPMNEQNRLFQKFYRGTNVSEIEHDGSGLGLYFVKKVLDLMGSKIRFTSIEDKGTEFSFLLPVTKNIKQRKTRPLP